MIKKVVFIDMDGVIVDLGTNINNWFNKHPDLHKKYNKILTISLGFLEIHHQLKELLKQLIN
jgi:5'(3')-deoxyribonucleotidase